LSVLIRSIESASCPRVGPCGSAKSWRAVGFRPPAACPFSTAPSLGRDLLRRQFSRFLATALGNDRSGDRREDSRGSESRSGVDQIHLAGMHFTGYHGVLAEERALGQRFVVDCTLHVDLSRACVTDALEDTVDYARVYEVVRGVVCGEPSNLVEAVAEDVCAAILRLDGRVVGVDCTVKKPHVAVGGVVDYLGVTVRRGRRSRDGGARGANR